MKSLLINKQRVTTFILSTFFLLLGANTSWGQTVSSLPIYEGFNYPLASTIFPSATAAANTNGLGQWSTPALLTKDGTTIVAAPIWTTNGLAQPFLGNALQIVGSGADPEIRYTPQTTGFGAIYNSFLFSVTAQSSATLQPTAIGGYFFGMSGFAASAPTTAIKRALVYLRMTATNTFQIGISASTAGTVTTIDWCPTLFQVNDKIFVVLKYTESGSASMFVNPVISSTEPVSGFQTSTEVAAAAFPDRTVINANSSANTPQIAIDEIKVANTWSAVTVTGDTTAPNSPGTVTVNNATGSTLDLSWNSASGFVTGDGYMVVRYTSSPNADNDPSQRTVYAVGNTFNSGTGSLPGTVVYVGTGSTFTNTGLSAGTNYYYKVYTFDTCRNYSNETSQSGSTTVSGPLTAPVATASTFPSPTGFTANWNAVGYSSGYSLYLYNANTQSDIVGWSFPSTWTAASGFTPTADISNTNNTTKVISQSSGTVTAGEGSGGPGTYALQGASWYSTPNKYWELSVNTTGYMNVNVSSKLYSTAPKDFKIQYKIGAGGTYADVPNGAIICAADWTTGVLNNLILPAECNNQPSVYLRWMNYTDIDFNTGTTMTGGTARIDDIFIKGALVTLESGYPIPVSGTSQVLTNLDSGVHYYDVVAKGNGSTIFDSVKSNLITSSVVPVSETKADYKTIGDATTSSSVNWQYFDGNNWNAATAAPTSTNNITISTGNVLTISANFSIGTGKTMTVNGIIDLSGKVISGAGSFILNSGASLKLGDNASIADAITTTTTTLSTVANYFYNGTVAQHTGGLPNSVAGTPSASNGSVSYTTTLTGNITISNPAGVTLQQAVKINTPGTLTVSSTGKLVFGDGGVASSPQYSGTLNSGSYNITGTGNFIAESGSTLSISSSKGISSGTSDGNIRNSGTRTFASGINYIFAKNDGMTPISIGTSFGSEINAATGINNLTINNPYGVFLASSYTTSLTGTANTASATTTTTYTGGVDITINGILNIVSGKLYTSEYVTVAANSATAVPVNLVDYYPVTTTVVTPATTNTKTITVGVSGTITGAGASTGWIVGNLRKTTTSGNSPSFTYEIGDASKYAPVVLNFSAPTTADGSLTVKTSAGDIPTISNSGIDTTKNVNRYWSLANANLVGFGTYQLTFNYPTTDNDTGTTPAVYQVRRYDGTAWLATTVSGTPTTTSTIVSSGTAFGDFTIGEINTASPVASNQSFCGSATVADLLPYSGTSFKWYAASTGGSALDPSVVLLNGTTYYVSYFNGFEETARKDVLVTINTNSSASIINVSNVPDLQTAINNSTCGDTIILADGHYTDSVISVNRSNITIKAATAGGVFLDGTNNIDIYGNNVKFEGFQFTSGDIGQNYLIEVYGSRNTLSHLNFNGYNAKKYISINAEAQFNTVEYCNVSKPAETNPLERGDAFQIHTSPTTPGFNKIRYCSFQNFGGDGGDYGNEPIRIGLGVENNNASRTIVEYCYFNNTGKGDSESVSIKSKENIIRYSTFTNQQDAMLVFRNGDNNIAHSNFFIEAGGIRVKEANNIYCYNNYFYKSGLATASIPSPAGAVSYVYLDPIDLRMSNLVNVNFMHNTFVDSDNFYIGTSGPVNNTWANNLFKKTSGPILSAVNSGISWSGNMYEGTLGLTNLPGMTAKTDLNLTLNSDKYFGLGTNSSAIDAATTNPAIYNILGLNDDTTLAYDGSGQSRTSLKDVGADEFTTGTITNRPLTLSEVGPSYLQCPYAPVAVAQTFCNTATVANLAATGTSLQWYDAPTGGNLLSATDPLATATTYYVSQTVNSCESDRTSVAVTINVTTQPAITDQSSCNSSLTVADLSYLGTLQWYDAATGGNPLASTVNLVSGTPYYATQTLNSCEGPRKTVIFTLASVVNKPTASSSQTFCAGATVADLVVSADGTKQWFDALTGGNLISASDVLVDGQTYYVSQTVNSCDSERTAVTVKVNTIPTAPTAVAQSLCIGSKLSDLVATGSSLQWYDAPTVGNLLDLTTQLVDGTTYSVTQTVNSCESASTSVLVTLNTTPVPTAAAQTFCIGAKVSDLIATGTDLKWYAAQTGGSVLTAATALVDNTTLYVSQTNTTTACESERTAVNITVITTPAPVGVALTPYAGQTVASLTATGTALQWYDTLTGGTALATSTVLTTKTYYVSQTLNSCESARTAVIVTLIIKPTLSYGVALQSYPMGKAIYPLTLVNTGDAVSSAGYTISPTLPTGLSINKTTGVISGTPTVISAEKVYTISGSNASGTGTTTVKLEVTRFLSSNNYSISTVGESCLGEANGEIRIKAVEALTYVATINNQSYEFAADGLTLSNLPSGVYTISISVKGETAVQIFTVNISKGSTITLKSSIATNKVDIQMMEGTAPYTIYIDDVAVLNTSNSVFQVDIKNGGLLEVKTSKLCEGVFSQYFPIIFESISAFPNPSNGVFEISVPSMLLNQVVVEVYSLDSKLIFSKMCPIENSKIKLNLEGHVNGVYFVKMYLDKMYNIKIIKQ